MDHQQHQRGNRGAAEESEVKENEDGGDGEEGADDGACPVCLEALTASKQQVMLPRCKHRMCDECFTQLVAMAAVAARSSRSRGVRPCSAPCAAGSSCAGNSVQYSSSGPYSIHTNERGATSTPLPRFEDFFSRAAGNRKFR